MMSGRTNRQVRRSVAGLGPSGRERLRGLLRESSFELPPMPGAIAAVATRLIPSNVRLAVASTLESGINATVEISCELAGKGFDVTPHLAARSIRDEAQLAWIISQMTSTRISTALVVGGDGKPEGEFAEAAQLMPALRKAGVTVGIAGYPEGHAFLTADQLVESLLAKAPQAAFVATQPCFEPERVLRWAAELRLRGCELPIEVGVAGVVAGDRLREMADEIGVGPSRDALPRAGVVHHPSGFLAGLVGPDAFDRLNITALRVTTFGDVASTESWRQQLYDAAGQRQAV